MAVSLSGPSRRNQ